MFPISDDNPSGRLPIVSISIILLSSVVFLIEFTSPDPEAFFSKYALVGSTINFSDFKTLYPFITSIFLHGGIVHILSNMWFLWIFGDNVESAMGSFKFLIFYLTAGIFASFTQFIFLMNSDIPMIGASGAIAGVLGAYYRLFPNHKIKTIIPFLGLPTLVSLPASLMLFYWFVTQLFSGVASLGITLAGIGGIAFWAHIGGFIFGIIFGPVLVDLSRKNHSL